MNPKYLILILCYIFVTIARAQQPKKNSKEYLELLVKEKEKTAIKTSVQPQIDSILNIIKITKNDTVKLKLYDKIIDLCELKDNLKYAQPIIDIADKLLPTTSDSTYTNKLLEWRDNGVEYQLAFYNGVNDFKSQEPLYLSHIKVLEKYKEKRYVNLIIHLGNVYGFQGEMMKQLQLLENGYETVRKWNKKTLTASFTYQLALFFARNNDTATTRQWIEKNIAIEKEINDSIFIARNVFLVGDLFQIIKYYSKAEQSFIQAIKLYKKLNDEGALAETYLEMGNLFSNQNACDKAITWYEQSEQLGQKIGNGGTVVKSMMKRGRCYALQGNYEKAIETHKWIWNLIDKPGIDNSSLILIGRHLIRDYFESKQYANAKKILDRIANLNAPTMDKKNIEKLAYQLDSAMGNSSGAFLHYQNYVQLEKKLNNAEITKAGIQQKFKSDIEKQKTEQAQKDVEAESESEKQKMILYFVSGFLLVIAVLAVFIFKNLRTTQKQKLVIEVKERETQQQNNIIIKQKHIVEEQHKEILDSINYAERIQRTFLASKDLLDANLQDYFILFKPKDVVSGDFYWANKLPNGNFAIATADSTGHGVPGAIMSLLNITSIEKAIEQNKFLPNEILNHTRNTIIERLKKDGSSEGGKDGMDCSLCVYDFKNMKLFVSSAHNPVWIIRKQSSLEFIEINPDKMPVGKHDKQDTSFTLNEVELQKGDIIYTLTDGFPDQFGGARGKKFMIKRLRELIVENANLPMTEQKQFLEKTFSDWVGELEQIDDVTVIGIKI
jgi:serine phosphatase RsbU (regulator of sigma subunit)